MLPASWSPASARRCAHAPGSCPSVTNLRTPNGYLQSCLHKTAFPRTPAHTTTSCTATASEAAVIPESRQDAVKQAVEAITASLKPKASKKKSKKGFGNQNNAARFCIELPVVDDSPAAQVQLVGELLQALGSNAPTAAVFSNSSAAAEGRTKLKGCTCTSLAQGIPQEFTGPVVVVNPDLKDVAATRQVVENATSSQYILCLNPSWTSSTPTVQQKQLIDSFEMVYCFQPLAVQILLSTREGAVLRRVQQAGARDPPWQVLMKLDGRYTVVFTKATRPNATDLEVVFYNTAAATSPVTKGIQAARSFLDNLRPGSKS